MELLSLLLITAISNSSNSDKNHLPDCIGHTCWDPKPTWALNSRSELVMCATNGKDPWNEIPRKDWWWQGWLKHLWPHHSTRTVPSTKSSAVCNLLLPPQVGDISGLDVTGDLIYIGSNSTVCHQQWADWQAVFGLQGGAEDVSGNPFKMFHGETLPACLPLLFVKDRNYLLLDQL